MADAIRYMHPLEQTVYTMDFQDVLSSSDSTLNDIGSGSTISAVDSSGDSADSILFSKTRTSKTLIVTFKNPVEGEEYLITFLGQGASTAARHVKTLKVLCRSNITGEF